MRLIPNYRQNPVHEELDAACAELSSAGSHAGELIGNAEYAVDELQATRWSPRIDQARLNGDEDGVAELLNVHKRARMRRTALAFLLDAVTHRMKLAAERAEAAVKAALTTETTSHPMCHDAYMFRSVMLHNALIVDRSLVFAKERMTTLERLSASYRGQHRGKEVVEVAAMYRDALIALKGKIVVNGNRSRYPSSCEPLPTWRTGDNLERVPFESFAGSVCHPVYGLHYKDELPAVVELRTLMKPHLAASNDLWKFVSACKDEKGRVNEKQYAERTVGSLYQATPGNNAYYVKQAEEQEERRLDFYSVMMAMEAAVYHFCNDQEPKVVDALLKAIDATLEQFPVEDGVITNLSFAALMPVVGAALECLSADCHLRAPQAKIRESREEEKGDVSAGQGKAAAGRALQALRRKYQFPPR